MRIVHLSDTHLFGDDTLHYGVVDTTAALHRVLEAASGVPDVDAVVLTGDLSDDGSEQSYRVLRSAVDPWAAERGAQVVYTMGNHDQRAGFEQVIGPRTGATVVAGVRIIHLDSSVPGAGYGEIGTGQLTWLRTELAADSAPTVLALHHPPTPAISPLLAALELVDPAPLVDLCAEVGVVAILAGHYHHQLATVVRGMPVFVAPAIANTTLPYGPAGHERAAVGSGFAVVDIPVGGDLPVNGDSPANAAPRATVHRVPSGADGELIFDLGPDEVARIAADAGPPR